LCKSEGVQEYPVLRLYVPASSGAGKEDAEPSSMEGVVRVPFQGARIVAAYEDFFRAHEALLPPRERGYGFSTPAPVDSIYPYAGQAPPSAFAFVEDTVVADNADDAELELRVDGETVNPAEVVEALREAKRQQEAAPAATLVEEEDLCQDRLKALEAVVARLRSDKSAADERNAKLERALKLLRARLEA
jgi:hypothetical protein